MTGNGPVGLNETEFSLGSEGVSEGMPLDDNRALFALSEVGAEMRKKDAESMVFAIVFPPEKFKSEHLDWLSGLQNLEQVQLAGTAVTNEDIKKLGVLPKLLGVGLDNTNVTNAGIEHLKGIKTLRLINFRDTSITQDAVDRVIRAATDLSLPNAPH